MKISKSFIKYVSTGLFITILGAGLSTLFGLLFHDNATLLFVMNFVFANGVLFLLKYAIYKRVGFIKQE